MNNLIFFIKNTKIDFLQCIPLQILMKILQNLRLFFLHDKPIDDTISDQKILFFYDFPELVD